MGNRWIWIAAGVLLLGVAASAVLLQQTVLGSKPIATLDVSGLPSLGDADAPGEIVLVSDYACPACRKLHREVMPELLREQVDGGRARVRVAIFPVKPGSKELAAQVHCAGDELGRDWRELFDRAYEGAFEGVGQRRIASVLLAVPPDHPDVDALLSCAGRADVLQRLERTRYDLIERGVRSVPKLIINRRMLENPWDAAERAAALSAQPAAGIPGAQGPQR